MQLSDKIIVITGAASGIGAALARRFAADGARLIVCADIDGEGAAVTAAKVGGVSFRTDVSKEADIEHLIETVEAEHGPIDLFCSNAGIGIGGGAEASNDGWQRIWEINVMAHVWAARHLVPRMVARGGGSIINFYSIDVETAAWLNSDYNITKSALRGLTRSAAHEWGRFNIRVNLLSPAAMGTVFHRMAEAMPGFAEMAASRKPLLRNGDPEEDIAPVAVFLASDMSRFVTGEMINVDGGLHMPGYQSRPANVAELEQQGC